ncbi:MAG: TonB family protein [Xanthobacteraceae bacterium]
MTAKPATTKPVIDALAVPETSKGVWLFAALVAISLHLTMAAFAYNRMQDEDFDDLGAPGIEIGLELMSPQTPVTDLPPGPDSEASVASVAMQQQEAAVNDTDLPKETPVESENPDRLVTIEKNQKPAEEEKEVKQEQTEASEQSVAQEAMAMPSVPAAVEAPTAVTIDQGTGESRQRIRATWQKELVAHFDKHKKYPSDRSGKAAKIVIAFELDRMGRVVGASIANSSGDESFDAAALSMVQRASPVPPPPPLIADEGLAFSLPVMFRLRDAKHRNTASR